MNALTAACSGAIRVGHRAGARLTAEPRAFCHPPPTIEHELRCAFCHPEANQRRAPTFADNGSRHRIALPRVPHLPPPAGPAENPLHPPLRTALHAHPRLETNATCAVWIVDSTTTHPDRLLSIISSATSTCLSFRGQVNLTAQPVPPRALSIRTVAITQRSLTRATTTTSFNNHDRT